MPSVSVKGKQNTFFAANHSNSEWRLQEQLVALFELNLQNEDDVLAFSPRNVPDVIGSTENVDILFTTAENTSSFLSFVEVRDHGRKITRQYIQEILGKRSSIQIPKSTIVSTKGFTKDAVKLAAHEGIKLRVINRNCSPSVTPFFLKDILPYRMRHTMLIGCKLSASINGEEKIRIVTDADLARVGLFSCSNPSDFARTLNRIADTDCFSQSDFFSRDIYTEAEVFKSIPSDGRFYRVNPVEVIYDPPVWHELLEGEQIPIKSIEFSFLAATFFVEAPIHDRYVYYDAMSNEILGRCVLARFNREEILYNIAIMVVDKNQDSGMQHLRSSIFFGKIPPANTSRRRQRIR